jgi:hypothetical protein
MDIETTEFVFEPPMLVEIGDFAELTRGSCGGAFADFVSRYQQCNGG